MTITYARFARVVLDTSLPQLDHPFDYAVPENLATEIRVGQRVIVPLRSGNRRSDAFVIELADATEFPGTLSEIESIVSPVPVVPGHLYELARAVADRQAGSVSDVLRLCVPTRYVRVEKSFLEQNPDYLARADSESDVEKRPIAVSPTPAAAGSQATQRLFILDAGGTEQRGAWSAPRWSWSFVERAKDYIARGQSVVCVVPDFRDVSHVEHALAHSNLESVTVRVDGDVPSAQRWLAYLRILSGEPLIVVGKRSAVYAPVPRLGLLYLWGEGDDSLVEPHAPYAHARDVALIRQNLTGCDLVLSSFVPSAAVMRLVRMKYLHLSKSSSTRPKIHATDLERGSSDVSQRIPSQVFSAIREALPDGAVLVHVAKPGFASTTRCAQCRERARCSECSGPLRLGARGSVPMCGWCGRMHPTFECLSCGGANLIAGMSGQSKIAEELGRAFVGARIVVTEASQQMSELPDDRVIVIATPGTEPLARNGYRAVIILDGEVTRSRDDLDTDVHALSAWLTAASFAADDGRIVAVGTGPVLGRVMATRDVDGFVAQSLVDREVLGLPPAVRSAVVEGPTELEPQVRQVLADLPSRAILGPTSTRDSKQRFIVLFDYRNGAEIAKSLRALIVTSAQQSRKRASAQMRSESADQAPSRTTRVTVRMDDTALAHLES